MSWDLFFYASRDRPLAAADRRQMRCSFFASEAMPVLEQLARALNLLVLDPQDEAGDDVVACAAAKLIRSWEHANAQAVRGSAALAPQLL